MTLVVTSYSSTKANYSRLKRLVRKLAAVGERAPTAVSIEGQELFARK